MARSSASNASLAAAAPAEYLPLKNELATSGKENGRSERPKMVEAAGRLCSASFEAGRTMPSSCCQDAGRVIRQRRILVRAPRSPVQRVYESLQGRPEVGPLPTPRRCHAARSFPSGAATGFADVSPVFTLPSRAKATVLIEPASVSPRQSGLHA